MAIALDIVAMCTRQLVVNHHRLPSTGTNSFLFASRGKAVPRQHSKTSLEGICSLRDAGIPMAGALNPGPVILANLDDRNKKCRRRPQALPFKLEGFSAAICELLHKRNRHCLLEASHCLDQLIALKTPPAFARWGFLSLRETVAPGG